MSMGGCYVALDKDVFDSVSNDSDKLSSLAQSGSPGVTICTVEQAWDAIRALFGDEVLGENLIDADLGETCSLFSPSEISAINSKLADLDSEAVSALIASDDFQSAEFYWDNVWRDDEDGTEELIDYVLSVKNLFADAAANGRVVLFYVG